MLQFQTTYVWIQLHFGQTYLSYWNASRQLSEGTLYSILKRLERKGYIESYWGDETQGGRRKYYRITEEGKDLHHNKMQSWIDINDIISTVNEKWLELSIQSYLDKLISFIELNPSTRKDLQQELAVHFRDKISFYQEQGFNEKEAEEKTKLDFGDEKKFAWKLNNAYFPFWNSILVSLSLLSMLFSVIVSFSLLTFQQVFPFLWLTITIGSSLLIIYFVRKPSRSANHRLSLILLLTWLNILYFYGLLLMDGLYNNKLLYFSLVLLIMALILVSLSQILLGVIYQPIEFNKVK